MDWGTMWLLVCIFSTSVTGQSELASEHGFLKGAVAGFDPFYMSSIITPNPGRRSLLFQHLWGCYYDNQIVPNTFINNEEETNCLPDITVRNIVNYKEFKDFSSSSTYELSSNANLGTLVGYDNFTSCEDEKNSLDRTMLQFFKDTRGEVVLATSSCVTHTITISPFEPVTFTPAFQSALVTLYKAAINPIPNIFSTTFVEFIRFYGTHFARKTRLGSKVIFGKLFSTRAATVEEETARRRCVLEATYEALIPEARKSNDTTRTVITRAMSDKCGGEEYEVIVSVTGPLPELSLDDWALAAKKSPQPIFHDVEPLSTLFNRDWFDIIHQSMQLEMNGTALYNLFEEHFSDYRSRMMCGGSNKLPSRGCTIDSNCTNGTECRNEPYTTTGYICVLKEDATTTTSTTSTTTTPATTTSTTSTTTPTPATTTTSTTSTTTTQATTTSTTSTTTPTPATTTTLKPCPACQTCQTCPACQTCQTCQTCPTCPACRTCQTCPTCPACRTCPTCPTCPTCSTNGVGLHARACCYDTLRSHDDSQYYPHLWTSGHIIRAPEGYKVSITFSSFDTEKDHDPIYIYDGDSPSHNKLDTISGSEGRGKTYRSTGREMFVLFVTDHSVTATGWTLRYTADR